MTFYLPSGTALSISHSITPYLARYLDETSHSLSTLHSLTEELPSITIPSDDTLHALRKEMGLYHTFLGKDKTPITVEELTNRSMSMYPLFINDLFVTVFPKVENIQEYIRLCCFFLHLGKTGDGTYHFRSKPNHHQAGCDYLRGQRMYVLQGKEVNLKEYLVSLGYSENILSIVALVCYMIHSLSHLVEYHYRYLYLFDAREDDPVLSPPLYVMKIINAMSRIRIHYDIENMIVLCLSCSMLYRMSLDTFPHYETTVVRTAIPRIMTSIPYVIESQFDRIREIKTKWLDIEYFTIHNHPTNQNHDVITNRQFDLLNMNNANTVKSLMKPNHIHEIDNDIFERITCTSKKILFEHEMNQLRKRHAKETIWERMKQAFRYRSSNNDTGLQNMTRVYETWSDVFDIPFWSAYGILWFLYFDSLSSGKEMEMKGDERMTDLLAFCLFLDEHKQASDGWIHKSNGKTELVLPHPHTLLTYHNAAHF